MSITPKTLDMASILADTANRVVVCCGAGGVGKTTTAAAMALRAAEYGRTVCVLTIDPAKRLAQALGVNDLGNTPQRVPLAPEVPGELHAMMLDMRHTFDEMVVQYSGSERAQAILDNQFYQTVATSLAGTQEYMAMEKLGQLLSQDRWDLVVVDTPPSRNALDFLDAPKRLGSFMDSRLWRLLLAPGRGIGRLVTGAMGLAMKALSTVLGSQMLADAAAFVQSLDATFGGFREKADRTYALLKRRGTQFVVVSAPEPDALREASFFVDRLSEEGMPLAGLVLNRTHPTLCSLPVERAIDGTETLEASQASAASGASETTETSEKNVADSAAPSLAAAVLRIHADRGQTAKREVRLLSRFTAANPDVPVIGVPSLPFDVSDLEALRALADQITSVGDDGVHAAAR
jgi:anion-transporting  ArsA/GET3 family ATPase